MRPPNCFSGAISPSGGDHLRVHVSTSGFNIHTVGYILLVVGVVGALISMMFWSSWGGVGGGRRTTVIED